MDIRPKKVVLFLEIGRVKISYLSPGRIVECVSGLMFLCNFDLKRKTRKQTKAKETKEEKRMSVENLTGYDDIDCKFALGT